MLILASILVNSYAQNHSTGGGAVILPKDEKLKCISFEEDINLELSDLETSYNQNHKDSQKRVSLLELIEKRILTVQIKKLNKSHHYPWRDGNNVTCSCDNEKIKVDNILKLFVASKELHCPSLSKPVGLFEKLRELL